MGVDTQEAELVGHPPTLRRHLPLSDERPAPRSSPFLGPDGCSGLLWPRPLWVLSGFSAVAVARPSPRSGFLTVPAFSGSASVPEFLTTDSCSPVLPWPPDDPCGPCGATGAAWRAARPRPWLRLVVSPVELLAASSGDEVREASWVGSAAGAGAGGGGEPADGPGPAEVAGGDGDGDGMAIPTVSRITTGPRSAGLAAVPGRNAKADAGRPTSTGPAATAEEPSETGEPTTWKEGTAGGAMTSGVPVAASVGTANGGGPSATDGDRWGCGKSVGRSESLGASTTALRTNRLSTAMDTGVARRAKKAATPVRHPLPAAPAPAPTPTPTPAPTPAPAPALPGERPPTTMSGRLSPISAHTACARALSRRGSTSGWSRRATVSSLTVHDRTPGSPHRRLCRSPGSMDGGYPKWPAMTTHCGQPGQSSQLLSSCGPRRCGPGR